LKNKIIADSADNRVGADNWLIPTCNCEEWIDGCAFRRSSFKL